MNEEIVGHIYSVTEASLVAQMVKKSAWNAGHPSSTPGWEDPLEKGMVIHSSIRAWRIPWIEEPGWGLQSQTLLSD